MTPIEKAGVLIEALPHLQRFRGETVVIKYGGSAMENPDLVQSVLRDIVLLEIMGINPVVVHGGGKAISKRLESAGLRTQFAGGYRVTDADAMRLVEEVLDTEVNPGIVRTMEALGGTAVGFSGKTVFTAVKSAPLQLPDGSEADLGFVGEVKSVREEGLKKWVEKSVIPVVSPIAGSSSGQVFNVNADEAAMEAAVSLRAARLVYLSDVPGILRDPKDESSLLNSICGGDIETLKAQGVLSGGMLPKVESALDALRRGVGKVQFIDGRAPHSLLLELFTDSGIGTEIVL